MLCKNIINKESNKIIIINNITRQMKEHEFKRDEYDLKQNFFDPTKMSPPNNFIIKLRERIGVYN